MPADNRRSRRALVDTTAATIVMSLAAYLPAANVAVHVVGAVVFAYSVYFNYVHVNIPTDVNPIDDAFGGKFKYLTFLDGVSVGVEQDA